MKRKPNKILVAQGRFLTYPLITMCKVIRSKNHQSQSAFGIGTIIEKYDNIVLIKFEKYGVKKLNSDILIKNKLITLTSLF